MIESIGGNKGLFDAIGKTLVTEGLRLLKTHTGADGKSAKVYKDSEWGEHRVKFFNEKGEHQTKADYHTDDADDAHDTAKHYVNGGKKAVNEEGEAPIALPPHAKKEDADDFSPNDHDINAVGHLHTAYMHEAALHLLKNHSVVSPELEGALKAAADHHHGEAAKYAAQGRFGMDGATDVAKDSHYSSMQEFNDSYTKKI